MCCSKRYGFTIVEILVVLVVISLAIGVVYPMLSKISEKYFSYTLKIEENLMKKQECFVGFLSDNYSSGVCSIDK